MNINIIFNIIIYISAALALGQLWKNIIFRCARPRRCCTYIYTGT